VAQCDAHQDDRAERQCRTVSCHFFKDSNMLISPRAKLKNRPAHQHTERV
jgi:hypothetical protein